VYDDWPAAAAFAFLFGVAFCRGGATYAVARGLRGLAARRSSLVERPAVRRAEVVVRRYGAPAVTLCFLTVGVQTAVNAAAGSLRMPLTRYLPALGVGAVIWATVYVTIGIAVLEAFWTGTSGRLLLVALAALLLAALVAAVVRRRLTGDDAAS
jgi:membrane protein DedA with SNARE-associated domain